MNDMYVHPLSKRYASAEMQYLFSDQHRARTWRQLWYILAKSEQQAGLSFITDDQIRELEASWNKEITKEEFLEIQEEEKLTKHDVMAHLHIFAKKCPKSAGILHLGATSCYITDNADLMIMKSAMKLLIGKLSFCIRKWCDLSMEYKNVPCLGYTHFQPAQLVTVGKRITLWIQDLVMDLNEFIRCSDNLLFRGAKGTVGTQASFLELFHGDISKVLLLDQSVTHHSGFEQPIAISGQTYTRKIDVQIMNLLSSMASSIHKIATDIRLWIHEKEVQEPFASATQVGSSAMAYKRNPIQSERCCSLARHLMTLSSNALHTLATQWMERSLDDSAIRRITLSEAFLTADSLLMTLGTMSQMSVNLKAIQDNVKIELPYMATEAIIMGLTEKGKSRQECHERIRSIVMEIKDQSLSTDSFWGRILNDKYFEPIHSKMDSFKDPMNFIGLSSFQVEHFVKTVVNQALSVVKVPVEIETNKI